MVRKRGKVYYFDFTVAKNRVRKSTGETDERRALTRERKEKLAVHAHLRGEEPLGTVAELVATWLRRYRADYSEAYVRSVDTFGRLHLYGLADIPADQVTTFKVQEARTEHLVSGHSRHSANHWLRILKMLFNHAAGDWKMLEYIPWKVKALKAQDPVRPILPTRQTRAWLQAVDGQGKVAASRAVRLMLGLGLREMEAYGARWEWLDLDSGTYRPGQTKNRKAERLRVRPWLLAYLRPLAQRKGLICPMPDGTMPWRGYCRRVMEKANEACGLSGLTPHRLRGTFATQLLQHAPPKEAQRACRHGRITTTMIYQTEDTTLLDRAFQEIDQEMGMAL